MTDPATAILTKPKECWINVYSYPKCVPYFYSHCCSLLAARLYADAYPIAHRKVVYRIHVRMK